MREYKHGSDERVLRLGKKKKNSHALPLSRNAMTVPGKGTPACHSDDISEQDVDYDVIDVDEVGKLWAWYRCYRWVRLVAPVQIPG